MTNTVVAGDFPASLREYVERYGLPDTPTAPATMSSPSLVGPMAAGTPGTLWNNGPSDGVNAFLSQRPGGSGGPTGDHISTIADDFVVTQRSRLTEIRACFSHIAGTEDEAILYDADGDPIFGPAVSATLYIYRNTGGVPGPALAEPIFGAPITANIVTSTYSEDSSRCTEIVTSAGTIPLREYRFNEASTGVPLPTLNPGRYWLAVVGNESLAAFWATSNSGTSIALTPRVGATVPVIPFDYWTETTDPLVEAVWGSTASAFAFDIDGTPVQEPPSIPGLTPPGLLLLVPLLGGLGAWFARRRSRLYRR